MTVHTHHHTSRHHRRAPLATPHSLALALAICLVAMMLAAASASASVSSITGGFGLTGGTITTSGTLAANPLVLQQRIGTGCTMGKAITSVAQNGTATCSPFGTVTKVATGFGLTGGPLTTSGTISVDPNVVQERIHGNCSPGTAASAVAGTGLLFCQGGARGGYMRNDAAGFTLPADGSQVVVAALSGPNSHSGPITIPTSATTVMGIAQIDLSGGFYAGCSGGSFGTCPDDIYCQMRANDSSNTVTNMGPRTDVGTPGIASPVTLTGVTSAALGGPVHPGQYLDVKVYCESPVPPGATVVFAATVHDAVLNVIPLG